jgi:hypothetical protein
MRSGAVQTQLIPAQTLVPAQRPKSWQDGLLQLWPRTEPSLTGGAVQPSKKRIPPIFKLRMRTLSRLLNAVASAIRADPP